MKNPPKKLAAIQEAVAAHIASQDFDRDNGYAQVMGKSIQIQLEYAFWLAMVDLQGEIYHSKSFANVKKGYRNAFYPEKTKASFVDSKTIYLFGSLFSRAWVLDALSGKIDITKTPDLSNLIEEIPYVAPAMKFDHNGEEIYEDESGRFETRDAARNNLVKYLSEQIEKAQNLLAALK